MNVQREIAAYVKGSLTAILCISLASCSLTRPKPKPERPATTTTVPSGSAVPQPPLDVLAIPDAVPRAEQFQRSFFAPLKIWHDYDEPPANVAQLSLECERNLRPITYVEIQRARGATK
jgi:hypothetical protein